MVSSSPVAQVVWMPAASVSPGNLFEVHILGTPSSTPTELEPLGWNSASPSGDFDAHSSLIATVVVIFSLYLS